MNVPGSIITENKNHRLKKLEKKAKFEVTVRHLQWKLEGQARQSASKCMLFLKYYMLVSVIELLIVLANSTQRN